MKYNKDKTRNLNCLRKLIASETNRRVYRFGGNWIVARYSGNCWYETAAPYWMTERDAIEWALDIEPTSIELKRFCK